MQKNKKATIIIILLILVYGLLAEFKLIQNINKIYLYIINPIIWIALAVFLKNVLGKSYEIKKLKDDIILYSFIAVLAYIITYLISGLFITFGKNPYSRTLIGIITNLWIFAIPIIAKEYIRYKLINNVYEKDKIKIAVLISIVYIILDLGIRKIVSSTITPLFIMETVAQILLPLIVKNLLYSYTAINANYLPAIVYEIGTKLYLWLSPILPNTPWIMDAIVESVIPLILFLYIRYEKNKKDIFRTKEKIINSDPRNIIPLTICIVLAIWFAIGIFPIKPVAIASGSMEPELYVGDVAVIKKCNGNDIQEGDIIEYQMEGYTVIHRVKHKNQKNGQFIFITQGDNNDTEDSEPVSEEQVIGKVIFKIRFLGYPAIWLHNLSVQEQVNVDTGN
ncbi:MAG: signal peptidase I [Clostridia bacterium]